MPVYMVDRSLPGISMDQLAAAQKVAIETSNGSPGKENRCDLFEQLSSLAKRTACACLRPRTVRLSNKSMKRPGCRSTASLRPWISHPKPRIEIALGAAARLREQREPMFAAINES